MEIFLRQVKRIGDLVSINNNGAIETDITYILIALAFTTKSFVIAILYFFSFFSSRPFFWTACQKFISQFYLINYKDRV